MRMPFFPAQRSLRSIRASLPLDMVNAVNDQNNQWRFELQIWVQMDPDIKDSTTLGRINDAQLGTAVELCSHADLPRENTGEHCQH